MVTDSPRKSAFKAFMRWRNDTGRYRIGARFQIDYGTIDQLTIKRGEKK